MPSISKIKLPSGTVYDIKDSVARQAQSGAITLLGKTTTALTDGSTTNPIDIVTDPTTTPPTTVPVTAKKNDSALYAPTGTGVISEFIFDGTYWWEFGDMSNLGNLAYADTASGSVSVSGTVSQPTFAGTGATFAGSTTATGTVSQPTFEGSSTTSTGTFTPAGSVSLTNSNTTATVSAAGSGTATYTPAGSVSAPTISVKTAGATTTIKNPTAVTVAKTVNYTAPGGTPPAGTVPVTWCSMDTTDTECLNLYQIGYTTGDSITTSDVTVRTGDAAYESTQPTFTGTGARLVTSNISVPTSASFSGTQGNVSVTGTPQGTVTQPTFSGTSSVVSITASDTPSGETPTYKPKGTVSQPTFSGSSGSVTVTPDPITP